VFRDYSARQSHLNISQSTKSLSHRSEGIRSVTQHRIVLGYGQGGVSRCTQRDRQHPLPMWCLCLRCLVVWSTMIGFVEGE